MESEINEIKKMKKYQDNQDKVKTAFKISLTKDKLKDIDTSEKNRNDQSFSRREKKTLKK